MADENLAPEERAERSVVRTFRRLVTVLVLVGALGAWFWYGGGYFQLKAGQAAVLLRFGEQQRVVEQAGPVLWIPRPFGDYVIVDADNELIEDFGFQGKESQETPRTEILEATMQTGDNNIVRVAFSVRYEIKDPYLAYFRLDSPRAVVRDAAQAAVREVVGRMTVDRLLRAGKGELTSEARRELQDHLDNYESGLDVIGVQAQTIQAPAAVVDAFEDVLRANQNAIQVVNEAEGYRNEVLPNARAEAVELRAAAEAYREAKVAQAVGEAERFNAIVVEYRRAPAVTRKRLYIEAMEEVLPSVDKVLVDGASTPLLPYLPIQKGGAR